MGKPKKGKKGRQDEDFGDDDVDLDPLAQPPADEEVEVTKPSGGKKAKKGKKKKDDDWEDDVASEIAALSLEANKDAPEDDVANGEVEELKPKKKEKKKKKKAQKEEEDEEEEGDNDTDIMVQALGKKGNKAMSAFQMLDIEGSENEEQEEEDSKPAKMDKEKKVNKNLSVEETETAQVETEETSQTASKQQGKKNKKGKKDTKKVAEEEDIDALLAEIEKPAEKTGKKGKKKKQTENEMEVEAAAVTPEAPGGTTEVLEEASGDTAEKELAAVTPEDLELEFQDEDKPKKSKKVENDAAAEEDEGEEHTVKTAAQKKKEKKERQKQQKLLEKQKGKKKKDVEKEGTPEADTAEPTVQAVSETTEGATEAVEGAAAEAQASDDEGEDGDKKKKKDKRKKKKDKDKDKDEDKGKKKPAKAQIKAMQEALLKIKEEEERLKREEEEKERRLEEARREKEEQERLEKERKEKKKQKDKERIQKLKAEGKYLTPKQREAQRRAQQMLEAMRAQGLEIPMKEEGEPQKKKRVVYEKKKKRPQQQQAAEQVTPSPEDEKKIEVEETPSEQEEKAEGKPEPEPSVEEEEAKEAWDLSDDEEEETDATDAKPEETKTEEKKIAAKPEETEDTEEEEEEDDDEEESEEESEDDDEDEEDSEEDSDSEEESDDDGMTEADRRREKALARIKKRKEDAEARRTTDELRAPVVCVMGHVDTGKTKILDKLRRTNVQDGEAGGITQQIGATNVPVEAIREQTKMCKEFAKQELKLPGLLIIDTPGHESFSNLRSRGSSLCDIAILVVDIMHGLEPQTIESINLLKQKKTPFIVALNKIDRLYQWRSNPHSDVVNNLKKQQINTKQEFEERVKEIVVQFAQEGLNAALFHENKNTREYLSMVPTSAHSGDGMGNLIALICDLTQNLLAKRLAYSDELQATTMEVKALPGLGTTVDVILVNGKLKEMDTVILAGTEGPIVTQLRGVLTPQPMRELRVKANYIHHKEVRAAQGVKLIAKDLEKALAGMPMYVAEEQDEIEIFKEEIANVLKEALSSIKVQERGVFVQASTLGSLEALLEFLRTSKIPYAGINIGPVHKKDVMKASIMLEHDSQYATILAFDVKVEREAQELADSLGVKIFHADIIYHLFDKFMAYRDEIKAKKREEFKYVAVFPCKIRIMPQYVFNSRDPIVVGVMVEAGFVKEGTPLCVPTKEFVEIGRVVSIENNHKAVDEARKGQEVCLKIEAVPGEAPKMYGRHFDYEDMLVSKITRQSIDAVKDYFREDMTKADWQLIMELKKTFEIL